MFYVSDSLLEEWLVDLRYMQIALAYKQARAAGSQEDLRAQIRRVAEGISMTGEQALYICDEMEQMCYLEDQARQEQAVRASGRRRVWNSKKLMWEEVRK